VSDSLKRPKRSKTRDAKSSAEHGTLPSDGIWVSVLLEASLAVGTAQRVVIGPLSLIVGRTDEIVFAALDVCPHLELPFSSFGTLTLRNNRLVCPWHYWEFDVQSGQCEYAALYRDDEMFFFQIEGKNYPIGDTAGGLRRFPTQTSDGWIQVRLPTHLVNLAGDKVAECQPTSMEENAERTQE